MTDKIKSLTENDSLIFNGYQVVRGEFLSRTNMPVIRFDGLRLSVNAACLRKMPDISYVQFLVNPTEQKLVLRPCSEDDKDAFLWCSVKDSKRIPRKIVCRLFTAKLAEMMGWYMDKIYRIMGTVLKTNSGLVMLFDLKSAETLCREVKKCETKGAAMRKYYFPEEWRDCFGLTVKEHEMSMAINLFDDYTVFALNE